MKFELDTLRQSLRRTAQNEVGRYFRSQSISIVGLRGLRVHEFNANVNTARGQAEITAPQALVLVDLLDLLYGKVTVERVQVDGATLRLRKTASPESSSGTAIAAVAPSGAVPSAFRILGKDCRVELAGFLPQKDLSLQGVVFEAYRLDDSPDYHLDLQATLRDVEEMPFNLSGRFTAPDDFDFRAQSSHISAALAKSLFAAHQTYVETGVIAPSVNVTAHPGGPIEATLASSVDTLLLQNHPEGLPPFSGRVQARVSYDRGARKLDVADLRIDGPTIQASARGAIDLNGQAPAFDATAEATRIPLETLLDRVKALPQLQKYGKTGIVLPEPYRITVAAKGPLKKPDFTARLTANAATLGFEPAEKRWPDGNLDIGALDVTWDSTTRRPTGTLNVLGGKIRHARSGITAEDVSATIRFAGDVVDAYPVQATVTGNTCAARLNYDLAKQTGSLELSGAVSGIEDTKLATVIENTRLAGTAGIRAKAVKKANSYEVEADVDATLTDVAYRWYYDKAPGIGGVAKFKLDWVPRKNLNIDGDIVLASSPLKASLAFKFDGAKYRLQTLTADTDSLDVAGVGRCLRLPYRITGGTGSKGHYQWTRRSVENRTWEATAACKVDEIFVEAQGKNALMHLKEADFTVNLDKSESPTATLVLSAAQAYMPSLRTEWFVPIAPDPKLFPDYKPDFRTWEYRLSGDYVEVPPWKGAKFTADGYSNPEKSGLRRYAADVDGGRIHGTYERNRPENAYVTTVEWANVPSRYFLQHLRLSEMLSGPTNGRITYSLDKDDPGTLDGKGYFEVNDGKFSEDFLYSKLQGGGSPGGVTLPSLRFSHLKTGIEFKRDIILTPNAELQAEGVLVQGGGQFITGGDMDYDIKVSITPETASRIPMLMEYFNVEGHRLSQQNIELVFKVTGPTGGPRGQLAEIPPPRVTLVSGALEMGSEAIKVIDVPRKILVDLLKIGGGLVGATK